jgi:iduronate 2-sulfatase
VNIQNKIFVHLSNLWFAFSAFAWAANGWAAEKPNVLFIAIDDLRPELGCYGARYIVSPNIDRLAKRGVLFERAYCQQPLCNPSRTSLMTGLRPDTSGVTHNHVHFRTRNPEVVTLPQHFKNHGYESRAIGKMYHGFLPEGSSKTSWDTMGDPPSWSAPAVRFGPRYYYTKDGVAQAKAAFRAMYWPRNPAPNDWTHKLVFGPMTEAPEVEDNTLQDGQAADAAIASLRELKGKQFFLGVGFIKPHTPFVAPKKYWNLYDPKKIQPAPRTELPKGAPAMAGHNSGEVRRYTDQPKREPFTEANARNLRHGYFACISYIDAQVGRVLGELDRLGLRDNTIVLLYGDHGWHLGDHGLWGKITNFEIAARAPLIISAPGMKAGRKTMALTEFLDIYPTLAELAHLPVAKKLEGRSLVPVLRDPARGHKPAVFTQQYRGKATGYSIRTGRRRYTEWIENGRVIARELYDYAIDPNETTNLAAQSKHAEFAQRLLRQLRKGLNLPPRFARAFGSHMVLQQGQPLPVWGTSKPEAKVTVTLGSQKQTATADSDGRWETIFSALKAKGLSLRLTAETPEGKTTLDDILVGEVWLCAGQSNMEWKLSQSAKAKTVIPAAKHARLRLFNFVGAARGGSGDYTPELIERLTPERFSSGQWRECSPDSAAPFSAVGFFFGQKLLADLDVPVGLINVAMGGTPAEAWMRRRALAEHPQLKLMVQGDWLQNKSLEPWCRGRGASNLKRALSAGDYIPGDDLGPNHSFKPSFMWDAALAPLRSLPLAGVLWYQGESNAESEWRVAQHDAVLSTLITDWRAQWKRPDLPFLFVQLPAMKRPHWPAFRASQQRVQDAFPHTGMAVTIDLGHPTDVHPRDKQPVGERLARLALASVYGESPCGGGPRFESAERRGDSVMLRLAKGRHELRTSDEAPPTGFEVRDRKGRWISAEARIHEADTVLVISPLGQAVEAVRYAWTPYPEPRINLVGDAGLPVSPFEAEL